MTTAKPPEAKNKQKQTSKQKGNCTLTQRNRNLSFNNAYPLPYLKKT